MKKLRLRNRLFMFPPMMDGEDVYSGLTRLFAVSWFKNATAFNKAVMSRTRTNQTMPQFLNCFLDPEAALECTVYPYYLSLLPSGRQKDAKERILGGQSVAKMLGLNSFKGIRKRTGLKWCTECYKQDLEEFGIGTYKSVHQIEGIDYCPEHGNELLDAPDGEYPLLMPGSLPETRKCSDAVRKMLSKIHGFKNLSREKLSGAIRNSMAELGIINLEDPTLRQNRREVFNMLEDRYGEAYLDSLGVSYDSNSSWLRNVLKKSGHVPVVCYLMLLDIFDIDTETVREYQPDGTEFDVESVMRTDTEEEKEFKRKLYKIKCDKKDRVYLKRLEEAYPELVKSDKTLTKSLLTKVAGCENYNTLNRYYPMSAEFINTHWETYDKAVRRRGRLFIEDCLSKDLSGNLRYYFLHHFGYRSKQKKIYQELAEEMNLE